LGILDTSTHTSTGSGLTFDTRIDLFYPVTS
jgi:hypothetical protein